jgi:hypothetical protein
MLNPDELMSGKSIDTNGFVIDTTQEKSVSNLIEVDNTIPLKVTTNYNQQLVQYDENEIKVTSTNSFSSASPIILEESTKYVRICVWDNTFPFMLYQSNETLPYVEYGKFSELIRKQIHIYTNDTEEEIYLKLYEAYSKGNCDVYWEFGTYNFSTIFELMKTKYGKQSTFELPIGGNCKYFFNGSTIIATGVSSDANVITNSSVFGSWRKSGNYELYDGIIIANHMIYCVHDESSGSDEPYLRKYNNMKMKLNAVTDDYDTTKIRKCIGGGTGKKGTVLIENCYFENDNSVDVSYHGHTYDDEQTEFNIRISNCYFSYGFGCHSLANQEIANLYYCCNSAKTIPLTYNNWHVVAWCNEKRNE